MSFWTIIAIQNRPLLGVNETFVMRRLVPTNQMQNVAWIFVGNARQFTIKTIVKSTAMEMLIEV